jgi:hypothetical protein
VREKRAGFVVAGGRGRGPHLAAAPLPSSACAGASPGRPREQCPRGDTAGGVQRRDPQGLRSAEASERRDRALRAAEAVQRAMGAMGAREVRARLGWRCKDRGRPALCRTARGRRRRQGRRATACGLPHPLHRAPHRRLVIQAAGSQPPCAPPSGGHTRAGGAAQPSPCLWIPNRPLAAAPAQRPAPPPAPTSGCPAPSCICACSRAPPA